MLYPRLDLISFSFPNLNSPLLCLKYRPPFQDKKELPRLPMIMFRLGRMWRHPLLFYRKLRLICQIPPITPVTPHVVLQRLR